MPVPPLLRDLAGWAWRVLVLGVTLYILLRLAGFFYFIILPLFGALFATSLAYPMVRLLRRLGLRRAVATWLTVIVAGLVLVGVAIFVVDRAGAEYPDLVKQVSAAATQFRHFLTVRLHVKSSSTASISNTITTYLNKHESSVASGAVTGITTVAEALGAFVLWFFMTFFLLYDGENIWAWIVALFPARARSRVNGAGDVAWNRLAGFVRGTFIIALVHAIVAAVALSILRVPLVAPLTVLVFVGSFLPVVGSIIFGALAVAITLVTQGTVDGIILTVILLVDNQFEAHVMQPFLVGRYVRLHPLAVAMSIAAGGVLEGLAGAVLAVPFVAVVYGVLHYLATGDDSPSADAEPSGESPPPPDPPADDVPGEEDDAPSAAEKLVPETGSSEEK
jgi:predicted PurR-regulated permease PerM